jgi:hypothetical protein
MKIYKYRDFANASQDDFRRLEDAVHRHLVWCAGPDTLNDPEEFVWQCDYTATPATLDLLTAVLVKARGQTPVEARAMAAISIEAGRLETIARPVLVGMIEQCRNEIGIACFGTEEVRFVSQRHSIAVALDRARVSCVCLGDTLSADVRERIGRIASPIPLADRRR